MNEYRFEYDGEQVTASLLTSGEVPDQVITGVRLDGSKVYNGHIHGVNGDVEFCCPNVIDSIGHMGTSCERTPSGFRPEHFYAMWLTDSEVRRAVRV